MQKTARKSKFSSLDWRGFALVFMAFALMILAAPAIAQRGRGELQIEVRDPQGQSAAAAGELVSESNHVRKDFAIAADGKYLAAELAFGVYQLTVSAQGFAPWTRLHEDRSEVPARHAVGLSVAPVNIRIEG